MRNVPAVRSAALLGAILAAFALTSYAQSTPSAMSSSAAVDPRPYQSSSEPFWTEHGRLTYGFQFGFGLENNIPHNISHINMFYAEPQIGLIAWDSPHSPLPIKRFELISEGIFGGSSHPGGDLIGTALLLRFGLNPVGRIVPYFDAGSGPVHTTIDQSAPEITGHTQFVSQGGFGLQFFYKPQRAMVIEYHYFHMSNAGIAPPNHGFNGSMVTIGFRWLSRPHLMTVGTLHRNRFHLPHLW